MKVSACITHSLHLHHILCYTTTFTVHQLFSFLIRLLGDITRHLGYMGYRVSYQQKALDEYDYGVTNIKQDLRDGARLT